MQKWVVYMVRCRDDSLYTGITTDVSRRVCEHNEDPRRAARYTWGRRPVQLVYQEALPDRAAASRREAAIKALGRPAKEALIELFCKEK